MRTLRQWERELPGDIAFLREFLDVAARRRCPHGVTVGPLDDYGVPDDVETSPYSVYCWICNKQEANTEAQLGPVIVRHERSTVA